VTLLERLVEFLAATRYVSGAVTTRGEAGFLTHIISCRPSPTQASSPQETQQPSADYDVELVRDSKYYLDTVTFEVS